MKKLVLRFSTHIKNLPEKRPKEINSVSRSFSCKIFREILW
ncbi:unnamed protein product [Larinioides sclopetarius]|uniref:Ribosomal protein S15 n=1 Tax=Larinioides sclopetarius TaxID=280406 RepID=A0AAV2AWV0_9ARAC